jgi:protease-4
MRSVRWAVIAVIIGVLVYAATKFNRGPSIAAGSTLLVELSGDYVEGADAPPYAQLLGMDRRSLVSTLSELRKAERDDRIGHVLITVRGLQVGWAKAQELRDAIRALRDAGRHPVAYLEVEGFGANRDYYVASAAEKLYVAPGSGAPLIGLAEEHWFLGGLWQKIGVTMQVAQAGRYKGAVDSLAGTEMNQYYREQANRLLDSIDGLFVGGIAEARGVPADTVRKVIDTAPSRPEVLEALKLIDGVRTRPALIAELGGDAAVVKAEDYAAVDIASLGFDPRATFALIYGAGTIQSGKGSMSRTGAPIFASETVIEALQSAAKDDAIRAIVLRIDSPGGSAFPSEQIWQAIREARKRKPVIASFSDYAASGGYYLASASDVIVAEPATLTGSIGVFAVRPSIQGVLERFDVHPYTLDRGPNAEINLMSPELSPDTRDWLQADVDSTYQRFLSRVAEGRGRSVAEIDAIAEGRVWTGEQAVTRGLVDALGGLRTAVAKAKEKVGIAADADVSLAIYPPPRPLAEQIREVLRVSVAQSVTAALPFGEAVSRSLASLSTWVEAISVPGTVLAPSVWIEIR